MACKSVSVRPERFAMEDDRKATHSRCMVGGSPLCQIFASSAARVRVRGHSPEMLIPCITPYITYSLFIVLSTLSSIQILPEICSTVTTNLSFAMEMSTDGAC